jgi:hypothetical protein
MVSSCVILSPEEEQVPCPLRRDRARAARRPLLTPAARFGSETGRPGHRSVAARQHSEHQPAVSITERKRTVPRIIVS